MHRLSYPNLPNYYAEMGGESRHRVNSWWATYRQKSGMPTATQKPTITHRKSSARAGKPDKASPRTGGQSPNFGMSQNESFDYDVSPQTFTRLPKGGASSQYLVGGVVFQNGRTWNDNNTYLYATFNQK
jgi:hypothetical protein